MGVHERTSVKEHLVWHGSKHEIQVHTTKRNKRQQKRKQNRTHFRNKKQRETRERPLTKTKARVNFLNRWVQQPHSLTHSRTLTRACTSTRPPTHPHTHTQDYSSKHWTSTYHNQKRINSLHFHLFAIVYFRLKKGLTAKIHTLRIVVLDKRFFLTVYVSGSWNRDNWVTFGSSIEQYWTCLILTAIIALDIRFSFTPRFSYSVLQPVRSFLRKQHIGYLWASVTLTLSIF